MGANEGRLQTLPGQPSPPTPTEPAPALNGVLVSLNISMWNGRKHDRAVSDEVARTHAARKGRNGSDSIGRYNKVLVDRHESETYAALEKERSGARTRLYEITLPLAIDGLQVLTAAGIEAFEKEYHERQWAFEALADIFTGQYPSILTAAETRLEGLFRRSDYPTQDDMRRRFSFGWRTMPIPDASQFRLPSIGAEAETRLRAQMAEDMREQLAMAARDPWERMYRVVKAMAGKLRAYGTDQTTGKKVGVFRDSLVDNVQELAEILPRLNLLGDPELDDMADRLVADLCRSTGDELRDDDALRKSTAEAADSMLADLAQYQPDNGA